MTPTTTSPTSRVAASPLNLRCKFAVEFVATAFRRAKLQLPLSFHCGVVAESVAPGLALRDRAAVAAAFEFIALWLYQWFYQCSSAFISGAFDFCIQATNLKSSTAPCT
jgi:hypothetical protein